MINLFLDPKTHLHYYTGENICNCCYEDIFGNAIHVAMTCLKTEKLGPHQYQHSLYLRTKIFCPNCVTKKKRIEDVVYWIEIREVTLQKFAPNTAIPVLLKPNYDVKDSQNLQGVLTTWVADSNKGIQSDTSSCEIIDNTKVSRLGESWEGSQIGLSPDKVEDKNRLLNVDEIDKFLLSQKDSVPAIDENKKRMINND